ncbi:PQQ-binding-like beta-propeller repeat protein [Streptomyces sp. NPDC059071]|uniref:outer membrane protein assembly factor BamB family protein n=1 Tax=unclassified Streptomyces TaxID=2593676 RepID=UPI0036655260
MAARGTGGAAAGSRGPWIAWLVVLGVLLALGGGLASCVASETGHMPGDSMERAWDTPYDKPAAPYGNAAWVVGDTVVRSRFDAVTGFDARTGARRWEYAVPGRAEICATSGVGGGAAPGDTADAVALIGLMDPGTGGRTGQAGKGCATVAAIDLKTGRELWRTTRTPGDTDPEDATGVLATGSGLAVLRDEDAQWDEDPGRRTRPVLPGDRALRAFDPRTGAPRWKAAVPDGCVPRAVAVAPERVLAALRCATEAKLAAFDPATGKELWTSALGARRPVDPKAVVSFLSAEPTVLMVQDAVPHGLHAFVGFGADGRRQGEFQLGSGAVAAADGKVFDSSGSGVTAVDPATGKELWTSESWGSWREATAMHAGDGRVSVFTRSRKGLDELYVLDAATGEEVDRRTFDRDTDDGNEELAGLFRHEDLWIAARWGQGERRPFSAYRTW